MNTVAKSTSLGALGLPRGDHWVKFHVEGDSISFEIAASAPHASAEGTSQPTGFVQKWGGSAKKIDSNEDARLAHINEKHLR